MPREIIDVTGQKFGRLTAIKLVGVSNKNTRWVFRCECGKEKEAFKANVKSGSIQSCGCLCKERNAEKNAKDVTNQKFGEVIALKKLRKDAANNWVWQCQCNCGKIFESIARNLIRGAVKSCGCVRARKGKESRLWKGGKYSHKGYIYVYSPDHPYAVKGKYVLEHCLVMEQKIGRYLLPNENVHHKHGNKADNQIENLELWVKTQPAGQRAEDLVAFAKEILKTYGHLFPA